MFVHLGNDVSVRAREIVAICDWGIFASGGNRDFLDRLREQGSLEESGIPPGEAKSLVVTGSKAYLSAISALTLRSRAEGMY